MADPDAFEWANTYCDFFDKGLGEFRSWTANPSSKHMSLRRDEDRKKGEASDWSHSNHWSAFFMDEEVMPLLMSMVMDNARFSGMLDSLKVKLKLPANLDARDFSISKDRIQKMLDGKHESINLKATAAGEFVVLDFWKRSKSKVPKISIVTDQNDITKPFIVLVRNADGEISHCSIRDYDGEGNLNFRGIYSQIYELEKKERFQIVNHFTSLHHTDPSFEVFDFKVPEGWSWLDSTDPEMAYQYDADGNRSEVHYAPLPQNRRIHQAMWWRGLVFLFVIGLIFIVIKSMQSSSANPNS